MIPICVLVIPGKGIDTWRMIPNGRSSAMQGLRQSAVLVGALLAVLVIAGCYVDPAQPDPFAPKTAYRINPADIPEAEASEAPDGFFGGGGVFDGGIL